MSSNIFEKTLKKIQERSADITKKQILSHNRECFRLHFDDGEGRVFIYPNECIESKDVGYIYEGLYQGADLLGVKVYESKNVEMNKFKDLKALKSPAGKELFSLDELAEFDYSHTNKIWKPAIFKNSQQKNTIRAITSVVKDMVHNRKVNG